MSPVRGGGPSTLGGVAGLPAPRRAACFFVAACLFAAVDAPGAELAPELRIFEIRRANSDFSPLDGLSFRVETDGVGVAVSDWLATLARRIPDAYQIGRASWRERV